MKITVTRQAGTVIVTVSGRLSSAVADLFQDQLLAELEETPTALVVDFSGLRFITSAGLRTLIIAAKRARNDGYHVHLCGMADTIHEVFEVSGLLRIFVVHPSLEAGLAAAERGVAASTA
ncbi:Anti-sigma factor antagonist [Candidatus Terasakiella magnetica]|nr:Anti-sigma factor antagonist [Candidatus Terasakiella magnetica]